jgi:hypothetical protein
MSCTCAAESSEALLLVAAAWVYFCRVGTDNGVDTEPASGSEVQAGRAADCSARVSVESTHSRGNSARFHDSN